MELRHLRYFVAVACHGSFNRAAESLHLTQPPLSRQVKDLEEELGVTLLVRGSNSVKLTEAGELFYEEARELLARAEDAVARMRGETGKEVLRVRLHPFDGCWHNCERAGEVPSDRPTGADRVG